MNVVIIGLLIIAIIGCACVIYYSVKQIVGSVTKVIDNANNMLAIMDDIYCDLVDIQHQIERMVNARENHEEQVESYE